MSDQEQKNQDTGPSVCRLTPEERAELRRDMAEASAWARAELARRKRDKKQ
ncbi:hypothetical protein [Thiolapillus sp.]|uniref:hypothetical protein n=1 Tax=Thiolapillus sp. TaxID=2017437 RepID=UPI003AF64E1F